MKHQRKISVIGLGYVGLPVAVAFGLKDLTIGFDIQKKRIEELKNLFDRTHEVDSADLKQTQILYTSDLNDLKKADFHIVAVPTPVDDANQPDLTPLIKASETVGKILKKGDIVVYESTVYPGVTEDVAVPILEKMSGLKGGLDFKVGYSPERINPGDKEKTFTKILKIVSAQDQESLEIVAAVYSSVVTAGVFKASSIKVAEAAKVIENTQRDLNVALMNELSLIFEKMNIDTLEVLEAAGTKWNFLKFTPGLVGGHCIGVDPYYLTYKAEKLGYHPEVILAGRRINDGMGKFLAQKAIKELSINHFNVSTAKALILGMTFKENCPDIRNSKVPDIVYELKEFGVQTVQFDPLAENEDLKEHYNLELTPWSQILKTKFQLIVAAVSHQEIKNINFNELIQIADRGAVFIDVKGLFRRQHIEECGFKYWRL